MLIKGRPLGIWVICLLLLCGTFLASLLAVDSGRQALVTAIASVLAVLFIYGLMFRVRGLYIALLLFLSLGVFVQLVASLLILSTLLADEGIDWTLALARYWPSFLMLAAFCGSAFYLGRGESRAYFGNRL